MVKVDNLVNWFCGSYCAKCGRTNEEDYGKEYRKKIGELVKEFGVEKMSHKDFVLIKEEFVLYTFWSEVL